MRHSEFLILVLLGVAHAQAGATPTAPPGHNPALHPLQVDFSSGASAGPLAALDRLPRNVIPTHYTLRHHPLLDGEEEDKAVTAPGHVAITIRTLLAGTNFITLHINDTLVAVDEEAARLVALPSEDDMGPLTFRFEPEKEFYTVTLANPGSMLALDEQYRLELPFTTRMAGEAFGFWVAPAPEDPTDPEDRQRMSATILEPNFARRVLPCFDEPDLKAVFDITIGHGAEHQALTHTEWASHVEEGDVIWDTFHPTPNMSVYQLCLVVVPTHYAAALDESGAFPQAIVGAWGPGRVIAAGGGALAAETTAKSLAYFQRIYGEARPGDDPGTPYSLSKLDSIVITGFPAGALENWGINTYRQTSLMLFPGETTQAAIGGAVSTQNHEVSHQWFGNLVTCRWWDDIWLNEGLANYMSFKGVAATNPEFDPATLFVPDSLQVAMRADQNHANTHPIRFPALPANWMGIFDTISYSKGGSLLRMLEGVLGEELFIAGLRDYLKTWSFAAADQDDLFEAIDRAVDASSSMPRPLPAGMTVKSLMQRWTLQAGYPLVQLSKAGASRIFISQERFGAAGGAVPNAFWDIPIKIAVAGGGEDNARTAPDLWLPASTSLTSYGGAPGGEPLNTSRWVMANAGAFGYYRVLYDEHLFGLVLQQLQSGAGGHEEISATSRSQLHDDYWELEAAGYVPLNAPLALTLYLAVESHLAAWSPVLDHLALYRTRLSGTPGEFQFARYLLPRLEGALNLIGWTQRPMVDVGNEVILRASLLDWACGLGSERCAAEAENLYEAYEINNPSQINNIIAVDIQATTLCAAVASPTVGPAAHALLLRQYGEATTAEAVRLRMLQALTCTKDDALFTSTLDAAFDPAQVRPDNDKVLLLQRLAMNVGGRAANAANVFDRICEAVADEDAEPPMLTPEEFTSVVGTLAGFWHTEAEAAALRTFIEQHEELLAKVRETLDDHLARVGTNGQWMEVKGKPLVAWMLGEA